MKRRSASWASARPGGTGAGARRRVVPRDGPPAPFRRVMRILMVAADRMEFPGSCARALDARPAAGGGRLGASARLGRQSRVMLVANGAGAKRAAAAVDAALAAFRADAVVSTGFCGALAPELAIADIVVGDLRSRRHRAPSLRCSPRQRPHHRAWSVRSIMWRRPRRRSGVARAVAAARWKWKPAGVAERAADARHTLLLCAGSYRSGWRRYGE